MGHDPLADNVYGLFFVRLDGCGQRFAAWFGALGQTYARYYAGRMLLAGGVGLVGAAVEPLYGNTFYFVPRFVDAGYYDQWCHALLGLPENA